MLNMRLDQRDQVQCRAFVESFRWGGGGAPSVYHHMGEGGGGGSHITRRQPNCVDVSSVC